MNKRFAFYILILILSFSSCSQNRDWIMFRGEQGRGSTANRLYPPLGIKWKLALQPNEEPAYAFNNPVVLGNTIYFGSTDGNFYALDIESGYMRWVYKAGGAINSIPFADDENIYFGANDGRVYAVSRKDGSEVWRFQTDSTVQSTVVVYNNLVIFSSDGGTTYFLSLQGIERFSLPNPVWHYDTFQIYEGVMYFAPGPREFAHSFGAFDLENRAYLWIMDTGAMHATWYSFPALDGDKLFISTSVNRLEYWTFNYYAFNRETGEILWRITDQSFWGENIYIDSDTLFDRNMKLLDYMAPCLWKNLVIYTCGDTKVRAFEAKTGRPVWEYVCDLPTSSAPTVAGDRIYFGVHGDEFSWARGGASGGDASSGAPGEKPPRLICLQTKNGRFLWDMETEGAVLSAPVVAGKWMIFGTDKNIFYTLEELY